MKKLLSIISVLALGAVCNLQASTFTGIKDGRLVGFQGPATQPQESLFDSAQNTATTSSTPSHSPHHGGVSHNKFKPIAEVASPTPSDIMSPRYDVSHHNMLEKKNTEKTISKEIPAFTNKHLIIHNLVNTAKNIAPKMMLSFLTYSDIGSIFNNMENLNARLERIERHLNLSV